MFPGKNNSYKDFPLHPGFTSLEPRERLECKGPGYEHYCWSSCFSSSRAQRQPSGTSLQLLNPSAHSRGLLRCAVRGWESGAGGALQTEACKAETHGRLSVLPAVSPAVGMIYRRPSQVPSAPDEGDGGRGREKQVTPACSVPPFLGQILFTCRLQVAVTGPVNTTKRPAGLTQSGH